MAGGGGDVTENDYSNSFPSSIGHGRGHKSELNFASSELEEEMDFEDFVESLDSPGYTLLPQGDDTPASSISGQGLKLPAYDSADSIEEGPFAPALPDSPPSQPAFPGGINVALRSTSRPQISSAGQDGYSPIEVLQASFPEQDESKERDLKFMTSLSIPSDRRAIDENTISSSNDSVKESILDEWKDKWAKPCFDEETAVEEVISKEQLRIVQQMGTNADKIIKPNREATNAVKEIIREPRPKQKASSTVIDANATVTHHHLPLPSPPPSHHDHHPQLPEAPPLSLPLSPSPPPPSPEPPKGASLDKIIEPKREEDFLSDEDVPVPERISSGMIIEPTHQEDLFPEETSKQSERRPRRTSRISIDDEDQLRLFVDLSPSHRSRASPTNSSSGSPTHRSSSSKEAPGSIKSPDGLLPAVPSESPLPQLTGDPSISWLRKRFRLSDKQGTERLELPVLLEHVVSAVRVEFGDLGEELNELLEMSCEFVLSSMDLGNGVRMAEWVHYMMCRSSAPSYLAMRLTNKHLKSWLTTKGYAMLDTLQDAFNNGDLQSKGLLQREALNFALDSVGAPRPSILYRSTCKLKDDTEPDGMLTSYFEFVHLALGKPVANVELAWYDISKGYAKWVPAALLSGYHFEGIWHTSVRVFGKEYWFGGEIFDKGNTAVWGEPTKTTHLGATQRTLEELREFISIELSPRYTMSAYDVLNHNCNHFCNEVIQFLLKGQNLPQEILGQPQWAKDASIVSAVRPMLNKWLGNFTAPEGWLDCSFDDFTMEWRRRLQVGDMVLHRVSFYDRPSLARIRSVIPDKSNVDLICFRPSQNRWSEGEDTLQGLIVTGELWAWELVTLVNVPMRELYPHVERYHLGIPILRASITLDDPDQPASPLKRSVNRVLKRVVTMDPICSYGHPLDAVDQRGWFQYVPPCSICTSHRRGKQRYSCKVCTFEMCDSCMAEGKQLGGVSGGVFADITSPQLAAGLLQSEAWLRYRAQICFNRADVTKDGVLNRTEFAQFTHRLCAELGIQRFTSRELQDEMDAHDELPWAPGVHAHEKGQHATSLDSKMLVGFFRSMLKRALPPRI